MSLFEILALVYWIMVLIFTASALVYKAIRPPRLEIHDSSVDNVILLQTPEAELSANQEQAPDITSGTAGELSHADPMSRAEEKHEVRRLSSLTAA